MTQVQAGGAIAPVQTAQQITHQPPAAISMYGHRGVVLRTMDDVFKFANCLVKSGMQPKGMTLEACVIAIEMGGEIGLPPMAAIQNIAVINGRPSLWGDAVLAVAMASGAFDQPAFSEWIEGEGDNCTAFCRVRRTGGQMVIRTFSVAEAKQAKLWMRTGRDGQATPWVTHPKRMLAMRARAFALRDTFPDFLRGIGMREEIQDQELVEQDDMRDRIAAGRASVAANRQLPVDAPGEQAEEPDEFAPDAEQTPAPAEPAPQAPTNAPTVKCQKCLAKNQPADGPCGACGDPEPAVARK